jgi:Ca2+-binding RTX toxin-like protein
MSGVSVYLIGGGDTFLGGSNPSVANTRNAAVIGGAGADCVAGGVGNDGILGGSSTNRQAWFSCEAPLSCAVLSGSASGGRAKLPFHQMSYWPRLQGNAQCLA